MSSLARTITLGLAASAAGYAPQLHGRPAGAADCSRVCAHPRCAANDGPRFPELSAETSRRAVLAGMLGVGLGSNAVPAWAGYVTSLGLETTKPADADVDTDLLSTKEVQGSVGNLKSYKTSALTLKAQFEKDTNMVLIPSIRKEFDFSKLRNDLNIATTIFDDQTQLTIDRLSRSILYDLTELENASRFKKGEEARTEKKVQSVAKWFAKLDKDFTEFLAYLP